MSREFLRWKRQQERVDCKGAGRLRYSAIKANYLFSKELRRVRPQREGAGLGKGMG